MKESERTQKGRLHARERKVLRNQEEVRKKLG